MATGGLIPTNRTQTVTFYNTTPIVDKDKNIYYVPRFSKTDVMAPILVKSAYMEAFESVCPPSSSYSNITVSQWSPQDRTLVVKGNIDDFRAVTDEGACLNYFIISRTIEKTSGGTTTTQTFYYAFFITEVAQAGGGSIRITAEPDDFTNVFYLHNNHTLTQGEIESDYEPFNEKMTNCYVKRQHYNRVEGIKFYSFYNLQLNSTNIISGNFHVGTNYHIYSQYVQPVVDYGIFTLKTAGFGPNNVAYLYFEDTNHNRASISILPNAPLFIVDVDSATDRIEGTVGSWSKNSSSYEKYEPDNLEIFMNQEQTFRFKYQYRDDKYPVSPYDGPFTVEERQQIEEAEELDDLSEALVHKILYTCINYLVIETKSPEICKKFMRYIVSTQQTTESFLGFGELIASGINRTNPVICYPFINVPKPFEKFSIDKRVEFLAILDGCIETRSDTIDKYNQHLVKRIIHYLSHNAVADYIYSAYVVNNIGYQKSYFDIQKHSDPDLQYGYPSEYTIYYHVSLPEFYLSGYRAPRYAGFYGEGIKSNPSESVEVDWIQLESQTAGGTSVTVTRFSYIGIMAGGIKSSNYTFELPILGDIPSSLKTNYYDPVLECEPYKFYSISSYGNYELVFNKNRYYTTGYVDVSYYYSVNGGVKVSYIPNYNVNNYETPYYTEGLTFTIASSLPLSSSSYDSYYNQNRAQMLNQYAVTEKNFNYDMLQHFFVSGPNAVGLSASKRGWVGAVTETANQVMQMVDEHIDYAQNKDIIGLNQKAKLADVGNAPDTLKQTGSDVIYDLKTRENFLFLNHYSIDELSYNSIAKLLERIGYQVNLYDSLNVVDRVGWNYVELISFDYKPNVDIMTSQEERVRQIFKNGVTLLHDKSYLSAGHNYETILE